MAMLSAVPTEESIPPSLRNRSSRVSTCVHYTCDLVWGQNCYAMLIRVNRFMICHARHVSYDTLSKIDNPCLATCLNQTLIFEWYVV